MSEFGKQIQNRIQNDENAQERDLRVLGAAAKGQQIGTQSGDISAEYTIGQIEQILRYLHVSLPEEVSVKKELEEQIDAVLRPSGTTCRQVELTGNWWKSGDGPLLAVLKASDSAAAQVIALIPGVFGGYYYTMNDRRERVTNRNQGIFHTDAWCFYKPLPAHSVTGKEFLWFLLKSIATSDVLLFLSSFLLTTLIGTITPAVTMYALDRLVPSGQEFLLIPVAGLLFSTALGSLLLNITKASALSRMSTRLDVISQNAVFSRLMYLPASFFEGKSPGEVAQKVSALNQVPTLLCGILFGCVGSVFVSMVYVGEFILLVPILAVPVLVIYAVQILILWATIRQESRYVRQALTGAELNSGRIYELISGIQKIKVSASEKRALSKWMETYSEKLRPTYAVRFPFSFRLPIMTAVSLLGTAWIYSIAYRNHLSVAEFAGVSSAFGLAVSALSTVGYSGSSIARLRPILERGKPILETVLEESEGKKSVQSLRGLIELNKVTFSYDAQGPQVLKDLSVRIEPGEYVAITGASGCGKSTLMRLLLGFETPQQGAVFYDGDDIEGLDKRSLRRHIGAALQEGRLFTADIYSNITIGVPWVGMDEAWDAAEKAGIADDIRQMPMGMHTYVTENGGGISGGQKQRLLIARAICQNPSVLIFDEATSALDNLTQKTVTDSLNKMDCTRIVIAHRLSTIRDCDRILVLDQGNIREEGSYEELMEKNGLFAELVNRQLADNTA